MADFTFVFNLFFLFLGASVITSTDVTVKTSIGYLVGFRRDVEFSGQVKPVAKFLGVPYAEPPIGRLRFNTPRAKEPFAGYLKVQEYAHRCLEVFPPHGTTGSEDCLYLNIFAPDTLGRESLAVMIYFHGGGFEGGSGQDYYGDVLATYGHAIVVTVNYRLGVWGFLSTGSYHSHGNYGLWDQRLAIMWVHDNIEKFGGDQNRITIFGESAGASAVIYQGLYPGNNGLFQRIIAQSGTASTFWAVNKTPKEGADRLAQATGCNKESLTDMMDCLRGLPASTIQTAAKGFSNYYIPYFAPTIDNIFVACNPEEVLSLEKVSSSYDAARNVFATFDLIIGINSNDGGESLHAGYGFPDPETFLPNKTHFDQVMVPSLVQAVYGDTLDGSTTRAVTDAIVQQYTDKDDPQNPYRIRQHFLDMHTDVNYLAPMKRTIDTHSKRSTKSTYMYYFSVEPPFHVLSVPSWFQGTNHADDLLYVFPSELYPVEKKQELLGLQVIGMWTNFAKTGNPNQPTDVGVQWDQYYESAHNYLDITTDMTSDNLKEGLHEGRALFWNEKIPGLINDRGQACNYVYYASDAPNRMKSMGILLMATMLATASLVSYF